jgi:molybdate transport system substrate-binding protein
MNRRRLLTTSAASAVVVAALTVAVVAATGNPQQRPLTIYAAASLTDAFGAYDGGQRYSFGGSSTLETQIRNGAPADLFASAAPLHAQRLFREGLVRKPVSFTTNRLALIVPRSNPAGIRSVYDLQRKPVKLVVAAPSVPAGGYTRTVLRRLGLLSVLSKVVSREPDVRAVAGKVALGQADAGFVYMTDARAVRARVRAISIPQQAQPSVRYEIAVVSTSTRKAAARAWISRLLSPKGQAALRSHGFVPLPRPTR